MSHELTIGAAAGCALQLSDPTRCVMRRHARLSSERSGWMLRDLDSTNGTRLDGSRRAVFPLKPGVEVGIGRITLIAESRALVALHGFLARLLGFGADGLLARSEVDTSFDISRHAG